jgi:hypothetical protein
LRFLGWIAVCGAVGVFFVKPGYQWIRQWRLEQNLGDARKALEEVRMQEARDLSLTVLRAGDPRIEALRILEEATAALSDPIHTDVAGALISHPEGSEQDRLKGFLGMVRDVPLGLVGKAWTELSGTDRKDPRFAAAFAARLIDEGRLGEATAVLLEVAEARRDDATRRGLVRVLISSGRRDGFREAQKMIADWWPAGGDEPAEWLDLLESIPAESLDRDLAAPLRKRIESAGNISPGRRALALARLDYATRIGERAAVIDRAILEWKARAPVELGRFLTGLGLDSRLLETFADDTLAGGTGLPELLLESAARLGDWERAGSLLDAHGGRLPRLDELAWRAVVALKSSDSTAAAAAWAAAMEEGAQSARNDAYLFLHRMAKLAGLVGQANDAMLAAIRTGRGPLPLYSELKPLLESLASQGQELPLLDICAVYLRMESANPVLLTQYAYLACLNDLVDPAVVIQALEPLVEVLEKEIPFQCALATAYLCAGKFDQAAALLDRLEVGIDRLAPSYRIVFLASKVQNGTLAANDSSLQGFPWNALLPSERRKFGNLVRAKASDRKVE